MFLSFKMSSEDGVKVEVRLQAAGDAPIMKQKNYKVDGEKKVQWILAFIRKYLKLTEADHLVSFYRTRRKILTKLRFLMTFQLQC